MADERAARVATYVRGILERDGISAEDLPSQSGPSINPSTSGQAPRLALKPSDIDLVRKIQNGQSLSPQEVVRVEAIVIPNGLRPAFDISHDSYEQLPVTWTRLNDRRPDLIPLIRGIGRLDIAGHPTKVFAGTACVVAPDLLLTNRHVAELFIDGVGDGPSLQFKAGMSASIDLKQEVSTADSIPLTVTMPALVLDSWDAAILRVGGLPPGIAPLQLASAALPAIDNRLAVVVGFPAIDEHSDLVQQITIFRGVFFKKRLMPGRLTGFRRTDSFGGAVNALAHDCTTLGGNSGSALIDVESGQVVGLHFAGTPLVSNFAVPTWELAADPRLSYVGVRFV
jgi:endonuclease G, mitochondrial